MPRKRRDKPIDFQLWTDDEKAQGFRVFRLRSGEAEIQSAPGRKFVLAHDLDRGTVVVPRDEARVVRTFAELCRWAESAARRPGVDPTERPTVGPVSAEFLASWVGFNAGRGGRFLAFFSGIIPSKRAAGRARVYHFDLAALDAALPGHDWAAMMRAYRAMVTSKSKKRIDTLQRERKAGPYRTYQRRK